MKNPYIPETALIKDIRAESYEAKTFTISLKKKQLFNYECGQFVELSLFGHGEFPASVSEVIKPKEGVFQITVRELGKATRRLMELPVNSVIGVRGPFGNGFPVEKMEKRNILLVAGGMGLSPLKYVVMYLLRNRNKYGEVKLLYGAMSPDRLLFKNTLSSWKNTGERDRSLEVLLTVDTPDNGWQWRVGRVTEMIDDIKLAPSSTSAIICGPSLMMKATTTKLLDKGFGQDQIYMSFERRMQCGMGMCGHCMMGWKRVCLEGPVFTFKEVEDTLERLF
ncbi:MAG: FAD/NAD(P)-binding protein [Chloroflexota bacterium]